MLAYSYRINISPRQSPSQYSPHYSVPRINRTEWRRWIPGAEPSRDAGRMFRPTKMRGGRKKMKRVIREEATTRCTGLQKTYIFNDRADGIKDAGVCSSAAGFIRYTKLPIVVRYSVFLSAVI